MRKILILICITAATFSSAMSFASVSDNQVTSQKINEADGTTGQNTNIGSGVKTGHIQDGAVTDVKISGPISADKIEKGAFQKKYANVIVVAKSGGDFSDPFSAVISITDASVSNPYLVKIMPGVYNLGINNLQMKSFVDVEGSGQGVTKIVAAHISGNTSTPPSYGHSGIVNGASNSEIRNITIENNASGPNPIIGVVNLSADFKMTDVTVNVISDIYALGFDNLSPASASLTRVAITAATANETAGMINRGKIVMKDSSVRAINSASLAVGTYNIVKAQATLMNVSVEGGHAGLALQEGSEIRLTNCEISANLYGISTDGTTKATIDNSFINSANVAIDSFGTASQLIANTKMKGTLNAQTTSKCVNVYDAQYNPILCQ